MNPLTITAGWIAVSLVVGLLLGAFLKNEPLWGRLPAKNPRATMNTPGA